MDVPTANVINSIDVTTLVGLRDRALIGIMAYSFARVSAVVSMRVEDYFSAGKRWWVRLHEKGGKRHEMPCHHNLEAYLDAYLQAAKILEAKKSPLFRSARGRTDGLTANAMSRVHVWQMIQRRAREAGLNGVFAAIPSARRGSLPISTMAARLRMRNSWRRTKARAQRSFTIAPGMKLPSMRSSGS